MIRTFCDGCKVEIDSTNVMDEIAPVPKGRKRPITPHRLRAELNSNVQAYVTLISTKYNDDDDAEDGPVIGDWCRNCVIDAVKKLDRRPLMVQDV